MGQKSRNVETVTDFADNRHFVRLHRDIVLPAAVCEVPLPFSLSRAGRNAVTLSPASLRAPRIGTRGSTRPAPGRSEDQAVQPTWRLITHILGFGGELPGGR